MTEYEERLEALEKRVERLENVLVNRAKEIPDNAFEEDYLGKGEETEEETQTKNDEETKLTDLSDLTVGESKEYLEDIDNEETLEAYYEQEVRGDERKGVLDYLSKRLEE